MDTVHYDSAGIEPAQMNNQVNASRNILLGRIFILIHGRFHHQIPKIRNDLLRRKRMHGCTDAGVKPERGINKL